MPAHIAGRNTEGSVRNETRLPGQGLGSTGGVRMTRAVKRTERGWGGHFIAANRCRFRRNTLLECGEIKIVVSTVGLMFVDELSRKPTEIGFGRHYETMAFHSEETDTRYHDADVTRQISFASEWAISNSDLDDKANDMHEAVVAEISGGLMAGEKYDTEGLE